jgi:hypothetical protein
MAFQQLVASQPATSDAEPTCGCQLGARPGRVGTGAPIGFFAGPNDLTPIHRTLSAGAGVVPPSAAPVAHKPLVKAVAYGQPWCGWSKRQEAVIDKEVHGKVEYVTALPAGCPAATAFPTWYGIKDGECKSAGAGFKSAEAGYEAAEKVFA